PDIAREIEALSEDESPRARLAAMEALFGEEAPRDATRREMVEAARRRLQARDPNWWQAPTLARYAFIERVVAEVERVAAATRDA
ncbi:hypothetical protein WAJ71_21485, partial [Acinetobacter baumannii]